MARDLVLPKLGENIDTATVIEVLVQKGDKVAVDQALFSLETDKAEFELPSTMAGTVAEILVAAGDEVKTGQAMLRIDEGGGAARSEPEPKRAAETKPEPKPEPKRAAETEPEPTPERAAKAEQEPEPEPKPTAETVAEPEPESDSQPDPETAPEPERAANSKQPAGRAGERSAKPAPAADGDDKDDGAENEREAAPANKPASSAAPVAASPSVRRFARELGVDLAEVAASTGGGRVGERDVQRHARMLLSRGREEGERPSPGRQTHDDASERDAFGPIRREPLGKVRARIAERMAEGWSTIPHVCHQDSADVTELERLREQYAPRIARSGAKLTMTAVLLKTLGSALRKFPKLNASIDTEAGTVTLHDYVNVAVGVDTERGLVAPVIRGIDAMNIAAIARKLGEIAERARGRSLTPDLLEGATFTLSNLGGIGGTHFSPIVSPPQVAVLGVGRASIEPRWVVDRFEPRRILPLSLSYDHRLVDGADAARFVRWLAEALEEPFVMDLEGT